MTKCAIYMCQDGAPDESSFCQAHNEGWKRSPEHLHVRSGNGMIHTHLADFARRIDKLNQLEEEAQKYQEKQNERPREPAV